MLHADSCWGRRRGMAPVHRPPRCRLRPAPHCSAGPVIRDGDPPFEPMNQGTHPEELPAEVLDDVASVVGAEVTLLGRLPGGVNWGAMRVQLAGRANAVLKAVPLAQWPNQLDDTLRAQRVADHMRRHGYPTPAWLAVGTTEKKARFEENGGGMTLRDPVLTFDSEKKQLFEVRPYNGPDGK